MRTNAARGDDTTRPRVATERIKRNPWRAPSGASNYRLRLRAGIREFAGDRI